MRAVIRRDGRLVVDDMAAPVPEAGQVLCRTLACGICGSDLHALDHYDHMIELTERMGAVSAMKKGADTVFGHEFCCEVIEDGPQTAGRFKPGTRVVSIPGVLTATGFETVGYSSRLPGGFAETLVLTEALLHAVPNGLSSEHAALTEPLAVGEHAVAKAEPAADHVFMVVGCGPGRPGGHRRSEGPRPWAGHRLRLFARAAGGGGDDGRRSDRRPGARLAPRVVGRFRRPGNPRRGLHRRRPGPRSSGR